MAEIKPEIKNFNGIIGFFPSPKAPKISEGLGTAIFRKMHENKHCIAQVSPLNQKSNARFPTNQKLTKKPSKKIELTNSMFADKSGRCK